MSYIPEYKTVTDKLPGNFGGETFREYCGLHSKNRRVYAGKYIRVYGAVTAQRLYIAIMAHAKQKEDQRKAGAKCS